MMPELLLQRADNKTQIKNSHPQTSQTPCTSNCKSKPLGLARNLRETLAPETLSSQQAAVQQRGAKVPRLICPCWHIHPIQRNFFFQNIHISQGKLYSDKERQTDLKDRKYHQTTFPVMVFSRRGWETGVLNKSETKRQKTDSGSERLEFQC